MNDDSTSQQDGNSAGELDFFRQLGGDKMVTDIQAYERFLAHHRKITTQQDKSPDDTRWNIADRVVSVQAYKGGMRVDLSSMRINIVWMNEHTLRISTETGLEDNTLSDSDMAFQYELLMHEDRVEMNSTQISCVIHKAPYRIELTDRRGNILMRHAPRAHQLSADGKVRVLTELKIDEDSYGLGARAWGLNLRGKRWQIWNTDQPNCDRGTDPLYYNVPFYLGLHTHGSYAVLMDNTARGYVDVGAEDAKQVVFSFEAGPLAYYVIAAQDPKTVISHYMEIIGKVPLPPLWYLGYHQSRFSYRSEDEVMDIAMQLREKRIPCDAIYLDIHYMERFKVFTWDKEKFPSWQHMIDKLHGQGFHVVPIIDPGVKVESGYAVYESGIQKEVFLKDHDGKPIQAVVWPGACHLPDFSQQTVRDWWVAASEKFIKTGIDGIWNDMNEPVVFVSEGADTLPDNVQHGNGNAHLIEHNRYGLHMGQASHDALALHRPHKRIVNIIRAGATGAQRYASSWTGDVSSNWDHLRLSIPMVLNLGLSGVMLTGPDLGGFRDDTDSELLVRWMQANLLMPYYRNHSAIDTVRQEPWAFDPTTLDIVRETINTRYRLMPYLYAVVAESHTYGLPVVRPMFMCDPTDPNLRDITDQYMLGDGILVAPIVNKGQTAREIVLPAGEWYDYWGNQHYMGGKTIRVDAPLTHVPMFVRGGTVLPNWPVMSNLFNGAPTGATLDMRVYPGHSETALYEDSGEGFAHRVGDYRWVYMSSKWANNRLRIQRRTTGRFEPSYDKIHLEIVGFDAPPLKIRVDRQGAPVWYYEDGIIELTVGEFEFLEITRQIGPQDETIASRSW